VRYILVKTPRSQVARALGVDAERYLATARLPLLTAACFKLQGRSGSSEVTCKDCTELSMGRN